MNESDLRIYLDNVIKKCESLSFYEKTKGLWNLPEISIYFRRLRTDDSTKYILSFIKEEYKKILIAGGGTGRLGRVIANKYPGIEVIEIDYSLDMVKQANNIAKEEGLNNFKSIIGNVCSIEFSQNTFDLVIAYGVFRFLSIEEHITALSELKRVSKEKYILAEPALKDLMNSLAKNINAEVIEKSVLITRMSFFYMLLKEYYKVDLFKKFIDSKTDNNSDFIDILTKIAGVREDKLYILKNFN